MQAINNAFAGLNASLSNILSNPYVSTALTVFALVFASLAAPNLSPQFAQLFDSTIFKIFYLFLILILLQYNVVVALIAALAFVLALQSLSRYRSYSYAQDANAGLLAPLAAGANYLGNFGESVGNTVDSVGRRIGSTFGRTVDSVGDVTYNVGKGIVNTPNKLLSGAQNFGQNVGNTVSSLGNALQRMPSAFSTPAGAAVNVSEEVGDAGCPVPASCQLSCGGQPMEPTALPPVENTEVSGLCQCDSEGPQGLRFIPGYENLGMGYDITGPVA